MYKTIEKGMFLFVHVYGFDKLEQRETYLFKKIQSHLNIAA